LVDSRHADVRYPGMWSPCDPREAFESGAGVIYVLVHPRQWRANRWANVVDNVGRLAEGIRYAAR